MTRHNHLFFQNKASTDRKNTKESQKREQNWQYFGSYFGSLNFYHEPTMVGAVQIEEKNHAIEIFF